jgi:hypothetical protein
MIWPRTGGMSMTTTTMTNMRTGGMEHYIGHANERDAHEQQARKNMLEMWRHARVC